MKGNEISIGSNKTAFVNLRENRALFKAYQIYKVLFFYPALGLSSTVLTLFSLLLSLIGNERTMQISGILWARFNAFITPMLVTVSGEENSDPKQSYIIVANHQSLFDIFLIYGWLPNDFRWIMKKELRKAPVLGYYCYKAGHVFIDRSNPAIAIKSINSAKSRIKDGTSILFFPEGTRSDTGELIDFKKGAFKFALDLGLPILPVSIKGTRDILPNNTTGLFPGKAKLIINKPIDISKYNLDNIGELIEETKKIINNGLINN